METSKHNLKDIENKRKLFEENLEKKARDEDVGVEGLRREAAMRENKTRELHPETSAEEYEPETKLSEDVLDTAAAVEKGNVLSQAYEAVSGAYAEAEKTMVVDPLTGLYNRGHFEKVFVHSSQKMATHEKGEQRTAERDKEYNFSLLIIDLNDFKKVNDTYGHSVGDRVLKEVAKTLQEHSRDSDIVCRIGGDEFAIISQNTNTSDPRFSNAMEYAEILRKKVNSLEIKIDDEIDTKVIKPNITIGVSPYIEDDKFMQKLPEATEEKNLSTLVSSSEIYKTVDKALYKAKDNGKNQVWYFNKKNNKYEQYHPVNDEIAQAS